MTYMLKDYTVKVTWKEVLDKHKPLLLPVAHDVLTARLILDAGFPAFQIGGFATIGTHLGLPDADLAHLGEMMPWIEDVLNATDLPVMVDASNGGMDPKMVARTVSGLETAGAAALFIEDQASPKKCGHMADKHIVSIEEMTKKLKAAKQALKKDTFLLARTDAYAVEKLPGVFARCDRYLEAGADGLYAEGIDNVADLEEFAHQYPKVPKALSILEGHGKTPWIPPQQLYKMGYTMILYPTTLLFRSVRAIEDGLKNLKRGFPTPEMKGYTMEEFGRHVQLSYWQDVEKISS